jgi:hypothetical protein
LAGQKPVDLAANLRTVEVQLRTGNGMPGGPHGGGIDVQEIGVSQATATLHQRLDELGIAHLYDDYGPGAHNYDYWIDDLRATLPRLVATTAQPRPDPTIVDYVSFEPTFSAWGHTVVLDRPVLESANLTIRPDGFDLRGSGTGQVTTAPRYTPGERIRATTATEGAATGSIDLVADAHGRVVVPVDLGPANPTDQYPLARAVPAPQRVVHVTLAASPASTAVLAQTRARAAPASAPTLPATGGPTSASATAALILAAAGLTLRAFRTGCKNADMSPSSRASRCGAMRGGHAGVGSSQLPSTGVRT